MTRSEISPGYTLVRGDNSSNPQSRGGGKNLFIFGENLLIFSKKKVITLSFEANEGKF